MENFEEVKDFVLPEQWCIKVTEENYSIIDSWYCGGYLIYHKYVTESRTWSGTKCRNVEITIEQFKKYVLKQDDMKEEIIGYKLKTDCLKFQNAANLIATNCHCDFDIDFGIKSGAVDKWKDANVLDLWFEPVYKPKYSLPKINGYKGAYNKKLNHVKYGCANFNVSALKMVFNSDIGNRMIKSITLSSDVTITLDKFKQIQKYIINQ